MAEGLLDSWWPEDVVFRLQAAISLLVSRDLFGVGWLGLWCGLWRGIIYSC